MVVNVSLTKLRSFYGQEAKGFQLSIQEIDGALTWSTDTVASQKKDTIIEMLNAGMKQKDIADQVDCSKSYVSIVKKELRDSNQLKK